MTTTSQLCQTDSICFDFERAQVLRSKGKFCDLLIQSTLNDNKDFIRCHRVILASVSPFFTDKLGKGTIKSLSISNIEHETLEISINYMYGSAGDVLLNPENVFKICTGAKHLKINQFVSSCLKYIRSLVTIKDVLQVFKFSLTENLLTLKKTCMNFIVKNLEKIKTFGFFDLDFEQVKMLVEHGIENGTVAMADILQAVTEWLHKKAGERLEHAFRLISIIPLSKIDVKILRRLIIEDDFLKNIAEIYSLYVDAVEKIGFQFQFQQAQLEKRKAQELDMIEETAVTDCEHPDEPGSSKRGRFSNECTSQKTTQISSKGNIWTDAGLVKNNIQTTFARIGGQKKALVFFLSKDVQPECKNSIVSFNLETKEAAILGSNVDVYCSKGLVYHKHKIYCLGGVKTLRGVQWNPVTVFDVSRKRWEDSAPYHVEVRTGFKTVVLDDYLYAVGGWALSSGGDCCDVERLKIQKPYEKWEKVSSLPFGRGGFGICVANGCIYLVRDLFDVKLIGGFGFGSPTINSDVICYTPGSNKWVNKERLPTLKKGFAVAVVGRHIYALGGAMSDRSVKKDRVSSVDIYDTERDCWKKGIPMNKKRRFFSAIVYNNCIYALGGDSGSTVERFSIERQVWEDLGSLPRFGQYHSVSFHVEEH